MGKTGLMDNTRWKYYSFTQVNSCRYPCLVERLQLAGWTKRGLEDFRVGTSRYARLTKPAVSRHLILLHLYAVRGSACGERWFDCCMRRACPPDCCLAFVLQRLRVVLKRPLHLRAIPPAWQNARLFQKVRQHLRVVLPRGQRLRVVLPRPLRLRAIQ